MNFNKNTYHFHLVLFFILNSALSVVFAQDLPISKLKGKELQNTIRLQYIPVDMPLDVDPNLKPTMGLAALHFQIPITKWFYIGTAMYSAVTGDQGGLFTLGAELGLNKRIYKNLFFDANFHFGGGGGYRLLINDGAFINTNIGLKYQINDIIGLGLQYSYLNFYTGSIKSDAVSFFIQIPSILNYTDYTNIEKEFFLDNNNDSFFVNKTATKNVQQLRFDYFFPFGKSKKDDANNQEPLTNTLHVLGFEYQKYLSNNTFAFAHLDAVYKGLRAGFMDLFLGVGYHPFQSKYVNLFTKFALGAAGGRIAPEGGLTMYPSIGLDLNFSSNLALSSHAGYYKALDGDFEAYTLGFGLKYIANTGGAVSKTGKRFSKFIAKGISFGIENQTYFNVAKTDSPTENLQLISLKVNYHLNKYMYLIADAGFAYDGGSGGYAHGLFGGGISTSKLINSKINFFLEGMLGAAGGAGVDTGQGLVIRPNIGVNYFVSNSIAIHSSYGNIFSIKGNMNSTNINFGINFNFTNLLVKK